jgi:hypothetical protein
MGSVYVLRCKDGEGSAELCQYDRKRYSQVFVNANGTLATGKIFYSSFHIS